MATIYEAEPNALIESAAVELQKNDAVKAPEWAPFVKTGVHKERAPARNDWWHVRAASVLRKIYRYGPIGVSKLRMKYGGKKNRGVKTEHTFKGSGNIIRKVLQQLEKAGYIKQAEAGGHKGRIITAEGKKFLDSIADKLVKEKPKVETPKPEVKKEAPKKEGKKEEGKKESESSGAKQAPQKESNQKDTSENKQEVKKEDTTDKKDTKAAEKKEE